EIVDSPVDEVYSVTRSARAEEATFADERRALRARPPGLMGRQRIGNGIPLVPKIRPGRADAPNCPWPGEEVDVFAEGASRGNEPVDFFGGRGSLDPKDLIGNHRSLAVRVDHDAGHIRPAGQPRDCA